MYVPQSCEITNARQHFALWHSIRDNRPMHRFALTLILFICGCALPEPPNLVGLWQSKGEGDNRVTLELRKTGQFVRTAQMGEIQIRASGEFKVDSKSIIFSNMYEGIVGEAPKQTLGTIKSAYEIQGFELVLYPGSNREERYSATH